MRRTRISAFLGARVPNPPKTASLVIVARTRDDLTENGNRNVRTAPAKEDDTTHAAFLSPRTIHGIPRRTPDDTLRLPGGGHMLI